MVRLYANENFPRQVVEALRGLGHDVVTALEIGSAGQGISDEAVLATAKQNDRAVVTLNRRDFVRLHLRSADHAGIIVCTQDADVEGQARRIHQAIQSLDSLTGQLVRVNRPPR